MRRRRLVLCWLLGCVGLLAFSAVLLLVLSAPDPDARFSRIKEGMTEGEVKAILGEPELLKGIEWWIETASDRPRRGYSCRGSRDALDVLFDQDGRVCHLIRTPILHPRRSLLDRLRSWLPW
jgi:hypothetical protein